MNGLQCFKNTFVPLCLLVWCCFQANAEPIKVCTSPSWSPYSWENAKGVDGLVYQVFSNCMAETDTKFEMVIMNSWAQCLKQAAQGRIQIVLSGYKTPEREQWALFTLPVAFDETKVFYSDPAVSVNSIEFMDGLIPAVRKDSSHGEPLDTYFRQLKKAEKLIPAYSDEALIQLLDIRRIDYFAGAKSNTPALFEKIKRDKKIKNLSTLYSSEHTFSQNGLHILSSKKWPSAQNFIGEFNRYFEENYDKKAIQSLEDEKLKTYLRSLNIELP